MSKKQNKIDANVTLENSQKQDQISQGVVFADKSNKKQVKIDKNSKDKNKKKPKKEKKGGFIKKTKETASELKKVTWPGFGEVVKKTGIVIAFVLIFGLFLFGVNTLLGGLVNLLMGNPFLG